MFKSFEKTYTFGKEEIEKTLFYFFDRLDKMDGWMVGGWIDG